MIEQQRQAAQIALAPEAFDYYLTGAGDETAAREAEQAWLRFRTLPRVLRDVATTDLAVSICGVSLKTPFLVAPTAFHGLADSEGECATRRGAAAANALPILSMRSSRRMEDFAVATGDPWWYQVYLLRDRGLTRALVERAVAAGASALVLTGDTPFVGRKPRLSDTRSPVASGDLMVNINEHLRANDDPLWAAEQSPSTTWADVGWLAGISALPVLVKGVLRPDDALHSLASGAAGVIVSNHGGRQSSRALATAQALAPVVEAVGGSAPVLVDGGIRSGADALVALALGATAVLVGRPVLWALAAGGADGVSDMLTALSDDLRVEMSLVGATSLDGIDASLVTTSRN